MLILLRNSLILMLLTLSSFGSMVCTQPSGNPCTSPLLINVVAAQFSSTCDEDQCPDEICPCDCESEKCQDDLVSMQSGMLASIQIPEEPAGIDICDSYLPSHLGEPYFSTLFATRMSPPPWASQFFQLEPDPKLHGRSPLFSTIVLRI